MMKRVFHLVTREQKGVLGAALMLAFISVLNALLALYRDRLLAGAYGGSSDLDMYFAAFRVPDFLFAIGLLFVATTAFIPVFTERHARGVGEGRDLMNAVLTVFLLLFGIVTALAAFTMPVLTKITVPGFSPDAQAQVTTLARILLVSPLLLGVSNLVSGVIQASRRFFIFALSPVVYNLGIIAGIIFLAPTYGIAGIAYGAVIGATLHLLVQVPTLVSLGFMPALRFHIDRDVKKILTLSFPRTLALSFHQLTFLLLVGVASTAGEGAVSVYNLAFNLQGVPLLMIGLSFSVAMFPLLTSLAQSGDTGAFRDAYLSAVRHVLLWTVPATVLFITLRAHIVRVILGTGSFAWADTQLTAASLMIFSFGIVASSVMLMTARAYYATGRTREPVLYNFIGFLAVLMTIGVSWQVLNFYPGIESRILRILDLEAFTGTRIYVLPLAFVVGQIVTALLLVRRFAREFGRRVLWEKLKDATVQIVAAGAVLGIVVLALLKGLNEFADPRTAGGVFVQGLLAGIGGAISYFFALWVFGNNEVIEMFAELRRVRTIETAPQPAAEDMDPHV